MATRDRRKHPGAAVSTRGSAWRHGAAPRRRPGLIGSAARLKFTRRPRRALVAGVAALRPRAEATGNRPPFGQRLCQPNANAYAVVAGSFPRTVTSSNFVYR